MKVKIIAILGLVLALNTNSYAQILHLEDALQRSVVSYDRIKSKKSIVSAAAQNTSFQKQQ